MQSIVNGIKSIVNCIQSIENVMQSMYTNTNNIKLLQNPITIKWIANGTI